MFELLINSNKIFTVDAKDQKGLERLQALLAIGGKPGEYLDKVIGLPSQFIATTFLKKIGGKAHFSERGNYLELEFPNPVHGSVSLVRTSVSNEHKYFIRTGNKSTLTPLELCLPLEEKVLQIYQKEGHEVTIARPSKDDLDQIREVQKAGFEYKSELSNYPTGIHVVLPDGTKLLGTSLIAKVDGKLSAMLVAYYKADGDIESQVMTVLPEFRRLGIAFNLKVQQFRDAISEGIDKITQTYDPLLVKNGLLNLNSLGGKITQYVQNMYQFAAGQQGMPEDRVVVEYDLSPGASSFQVAQSGKKFIENDKPLIQDENLMRFKLPLDWAQTKKIARLATNLRNNSRELLGKILETHEVYMVAYNEEGIPYLIARKRKT